jgi:hypothetical protein
MQTRKRVLGEEHPDTLTSMNNLAFTWKGQARDIEAIDLMDKCVQARERHLGKLKGGKVPLEVIVRGKDGDENAKQIEQCIDTVKKAGVSVCSHS